MRVTAGLRAGRSHRANDEPCQDAYAARAVGDRTVAAVADGLGSRRLSHEGSLAAAEAAVASLAHARRLGPAALHRAFAAARAAVRRRARELGADVDDLATTLHVAAMVPGSLWAASVGDGAVLASTGGSIDVVLGPADGEYANEVVPITVRSWKDHFRVGRLLDADAAFVFTDGLTRLLMTRRDRAWAPFAPFFDRFLPRLRAPDAAEDLVDGFLQSEAVDRAWDDDKCLVVIQHG